MISDQRSGQAQLRISEHHQPGPAIRLLGMTDPRQGPVEELFDKAEGVFEFEAANIGSPHARQIRQLGAMPPQPQLLGQARALGKPLHLDEDEGSAHQRSWATCPPLGMILWDSMQVVPGAHLHLPILGILGGLLLIG